MSVTREEILYLYKHWTGFPEIWRLIRVKKTVAKKEEETMANNEYPKIIFEHQIAWRGKNNSSLDKFLRIVQWAGTLNEVIPIKPNYVYEISTTVDAMGQRVWTVYNMDSETSLEIANILATMYLLAKAQAEENHGAVA